MKHYLFQFFCLWFFFTYTNKAAAFQTSSPEDIHVWEMQELTFEAENTYDNYYTDVKVWVDLKGPGFSKRIYGFWDGDNIFRVRLVATAPGEWEWTSGSTSEDSGLKQKSGKFTAVEWTEQEKQENPNRRGFVQATPNGHALQYADGTPYFMVGDTWLAGSTWRLPFRSASTSDEYSPGPGIGFEDALNYRRNQGFNSVSMIAAFPNWEADNNPSTYADENGIFVRNAWEKFGYDVASDEGIDASGGESYWGTFTAKNMRDEYGNLPFSMSAEHKGVSNFNNINPEYFQSLDKKMQYMSKEGFVPLLETIRRDAGPSWNAYFNFKESFARYVQYLISRYGAQNFLFSGIHLDWIPEDFSLTAEQFNEALTYHLNTYGPPPFGQPHTSLIDRSTYTTFGHGEEVPWLDMHSVGNKPRDHGFYGAMDTLFHLEPPYPAINFEPYYTGWDHEINKPGGETPVANSDRDNYFARAQMYGSVLSGGLAGHVHGTAAYDITTTGEPAGARPQIWDALKYESGNQMQHLRSFMLSEGDRYQQLKPSHQRLHPHKSETSKLRGLDGWTLMMMTPEKDFSLLYIENKAELPTISGLKKNTSYSFEWYNPRNGEWHEPEVIKSDRKGNLKLSNFPDGSNPSSKDWAAKILQTE
ncbi:DUF5060 domain-containing protein [Autumnicola psychrophila]|uniref:DUF5060 domain-containing protein n=1 Tax=Autumnicola psychrophila TaxID=3075592 RepID=A0ABU3DSD7_9FLAO|nr:DUF5060 domain-containing protein [Zunongwangia sp. F225]MDT0686619.1 DUF5060 domain-containing protein [Zunongwangia sp. F225]